MAAVSTRVTSLRLTRWHLIVWLTLAIVAATIAVRACFVYNHLAGTDKSPRHIAVIASAVLVGPMIGSVANPGTLYGPSWLIACTAALLAGLALSICPFLFVKRQVTPLACWFAWCGYMSMALLWFSSSILSLGYFLS